MSFPSDLFLIAEIGSVHDGSLGNAKKLIEAAAAAGADSVKFQMHIAEAESRADAPAPGYFQAESRYDYFRRTAFTPAQWAQLRDTCHAHGVRFVCSPFSIEAVEVLDQLNVDVFKIPSGEVTNIPMLERVATTGRPTILSSGMSNWEELDRAVEILRHGVPLGLMQCSSLYPCPPEQVGLNVMQIMRTRYQLPCGLSDHTLGPAAAIAATTLGADFIEKHFTFSRLMYGSDAPHSTEPAEWRALADALKQVRIMLQNPVDKSSHSIYQEMKFIFEKGTVAARDLPAHTVLTAADLAWKKPAEGLAPHRWRELLGRRLRSAVSKDQPIFLEDTE